MSNLLYPSVMGLTVPVKRFDEWSTTVQHSVSGKMVKLSLFQNPIWHWELKYGYLKDSGSPPTAFRTIMDFHNRMGGSFDTFLYPDPDDNSVTDEPFGTGDGTTVTFNLLRHWVSGGFGEWIQNINVLTNVKINGTTKTNGVDYNLNSIGQITFVVPPVNTAVLTWTGTYFFRCMFEEDKLEFDKTMNLLWEIQVVKIQSVKL